MTVSKWLWSTTANDNDDADGGINWAEGQAPSTVNGSARAMMAAEARHLRDTGGALTLAGSANTYTVTTNGGSAAFFTGMSIYAAVNVTNTSTSTLNKDGDGAKAIVKLVAGVETVLASGDLVAGERYHFDYNTAFASSAGAWVCRELSLEKVGTAANLASTANGKGASLVGIEDVGSLITATTVEAALAELRQGGLGTRTTTTGGTTLSFTSVIPAWAREVSLSFQGMSLSGTDNWIVQLGTGGTYATSGYSSNSALYSSVPGIALGTVTTTGFIILGTNAAYTITGTLVLRHLGSNQWVSAHSFIETATPFMGNGAGGVTLGGVLDSIRFGANGSNTIDANAGVNIQWR